MLLEQVVLCYCGCGCCSGKTKKNCFLFCWLSDEQELGQRISFVVRILKIDLYPCLNCFCIHSSLNNNNLVYIICTEWMRLFYPSLSWYPNTVDCRREHSFFIICEQTNKKAIRFDLLIVSISIDCFFSNMEYKRVQVHFRWFEWWNRGECHCLCTWITTIATPNRNSTTKTVFVLLFRRHRRHCYRMPTRMFIHRIYYSIMNYRRMYFGIFIQNDFDSVACFVFILKIKLIALCMPFANHGSSPVNTLTMY